MSPPTSAPGYTTRWSADGAAPLFLQEDAARLVAALFFSIVLAGLLVGVGLLVHLRSCPVDWRARVNELRQRPWRWRHMAELLGVMAVLNLVVLWLSEWAGVPSGHLEPATWLVAQTLIFHWPVVLFMGLALWRHRLSPREMLGCEGGHVGKQVFWGVVFYLASMPLVLFYTWIYQSVLRALGYPPRLQDVIRVFLDDLPGALRLYFVFVAIGLAPVAEELLFRGIGLSLLLRRFRVTTAIGLLSLIFAGLHLHLHSLVPLFLVSVAFSIGYLFTGSLVVPVVMHACFNAVNLAVMRVLTASAPIHPVP